MEKRKPWQLFLIIAVFLLTIYNILPTVLYYSNPLRESIDSARAEDVSKMIVNRVDSLEDDSIEWINSFSKNLGLKPESINFNKSDPRLISVDFKNEKDAKVFSHYLARGGSLIPFVPAQLAPLKNYNKDNDSKKVSVLRQIAVHLDPSDVNQLFKFSSKYEDNGKISPFYRQVIDDRVAEIALAFAGPSKMASQLAILSDNPTDKQYDEAAINIALNIVETEKFLGATSPILKRWYSSFSQTDHTNGKEIVQNFLARLQLIKGRISNQTKILSDQIKVSRENGELSSIEQEENLSLYTSQLQTLDSAIAIIRKNITVFESGNSPLDRAGIDEMLAKNSISDAKVQTLSFQGRNPFIESLSVDFDNSQVVLKFYEDVQSIRNSTSISEKVGFLKEKLNQALIDDIARASSLSDEKIIPNGSNFAVNLSTLTGTTGILAFDLGFVEKKMSDQLVTSLTKDWNPQHLDLNHEVYPIRSYAEFNGEGVESQKLGLVVYSPSLVSGDTLKGFRNGSIYIIARGLGSIEEKYRQYPDSQENKLLQADLKKLSEVLQQNGFISYAGNSYGVDPFFKNDYIFELSDYYGDLIKSTREDFVVKGRKKFAILDLTDVEQRLLTTNKIDDQIQEDLLKWKEEYDQAQIDLDPTAKFFIPPPTKNVFWQNLKLSAKKYFRGDDRKVLKWGLDLSGGKTVRIGLRDHNNRPVTNPEDLKQAVNELYNRINKMGVSERTIRIENENIILDFPGSQGLSASDLIKASAMYFHIVNEKFSSPNSTIKETVNQFLQSVWNEAVVTNRKDVESINEIAWKHLGGDDVSNEIHPRSELAKVLYENGLRFANPIDATKSHDFDDTLSSIAVLRGDDYSEWQGQSHPLLIVFHNYALEGASLTGIHVGYDPSQGNVLGFQIKGSYDYTDGNPRQDFYQWTSHFAEDEIQGTSREIYTKGRGWRMAVTLNDKVISMPSLRAALRDGGSISGHFSQREIDQLAADLKAGSLSFTPQILSEQNVSPELGKEERTRGIVASIVALVLVVAMMIGYYRFAGFIASCAVIFNLFIMWGILQNLGAALTLPGIAGIVLTIGMAVDANVLVFERIREEFKISGRIAVAIKTGYRKAFSAIVDSNVTTIIAALILLQFDSGPIKGFAVTLIVGIISSMFTALFVTRYYFAGWVKDPKNKELSMANFIGDTNFDFLKHTRLAFAISSVLILAGAYLFAIQKNTMFGMDFTGGYSLTVEVEDQPNVDSYRLQAVDSIVSAGLNKSNLDIRELSRPTQLKIQIGTGAEEPGQPFYGMSETLEGQDPTYEYQNIPRLNWVIEALQKGGMKISANQLNQINGNWSVMSGQFSDAMRNNALVALGVAFASILLYITLRFEFKYAISAVIALAHDLLITLAVLAFFHKLGFALQINLEIVGALMTIIGYSLNDKIIIFDRIREDVNIFRKKKFAEVLNHAINVTLTRTLMTSGTTLVVLLTLVFLGGKSIFGFSLVMTVGVVVGTLSSFFIACPTLLYFHNKEQSQHRNHQVSTNKA